MDSKGFFHDGGFDRMEESVGNCCYNRMISGNRVLSFSMLPFLGETGNGLCEVLRSDRWVSDCRTVFLNLLHYSLEAEMP